MVSAGDFGFSEITENKLPFYIIGWAQAACPPHPTFPYVPPAGWKIESCVNDGVGTHKGCSYCLMCQVKCVPIIKPGLPIGFPIDLPPIAPPIVPPKLPPPDADVMYQNVPQTMIAGQSYPIKITMQNVVPDSIEWNETNKVRLGADPAAPDTAKFGNTRFYIPAGKSVKGGEQYTFEFQMLAPAIPGTYNPSYRMVWEGKIWFGEPVKITIQVAPPVPPKPECVPIAGKVWECGGMLAEDQYDRYDCIDGEITFIEHNSLRCGYQAPQPDPQPIAPPETLIIPDEDLVLIEETPSGGISMGTIAIIGAAALALVGGFILLKNKDKVEK